MKFQDKIKASIEDNTGNLEQNINLSSELKIPWSKYISQLFTGFCNRVARLVCLTCLKLFVFRGPLLFYLLGGDHLQSRDHVFHLPLFLLKNLHIYPSNIY